MRKEFWKRAAAFILILAMTVTSFPVNGLTVVYAEETAVEFTNIAAEAEITSNGSGGTYWSGPENMVDKDDSSLYKFHAAAMDSEKYIHLEYAQAREMNKFRIAFEQKNPDADSVVFTYSIKGTKADGSSEFIVENAEANKTDNWEQIYNFEVKEFKTIDILMHSCTYPGGNAWPAVAEFEVYGSAAPSSVTYENIAGSCEITVPSTQSGTDSANMTDADASTMWVADGGTWPAEVSFRLPADNTRKVKKVVVKFEEGHDEWTVDVKLQHALNNVTSDLVNDDEKTDHSFANEYAYEYATPLSFTHTYITLSNPKNNGAEGEFYPAMAEVEIWVENEVEDDGGGTSTVVDTESIAYNKPVHSNVNADTVFRVNDGSKDNLWSGSRYPAYIDIDLEENYNLSEVQIFTPSQGYSQYSIYTSMDGKDFKKLAEKTSKESCPAEGEKYNAEGTEARILRVYVEYQSESVKSLVNEIRVLGTPSGTALQTRAEIDIPTFEDSIYNVAVTEQDTYDEVYGIIERQVGEEYKDWFTLELASNPREGHDYDYFELSAVNGKIHVKGNAGVSLAMGINHFLKYYCQVNISQVGNQVKMPESIPVLSETVFKETKAKIRYSYNYCTLSYSMAFYGEEEWRNELDWLALNGVNVVLDATAQEEVWRRFLGKLGYTHEQIKDFIAGPAYYAWAYMANLSGFGGPVHDSWFVERTELARKNQLSMRKLGMQPVLQGYSGMVPNDILNHDPDAVIIKQGTWCSFQRPDMLKTDDPCFQRYAELFYGAQKEVYGDISDYYATDPFHEGGNTGGMDSSVISEIVLEEMMKSDSDAIWIIQAWQGNPTTALLNGLDNVENGPAHALVLDLYAEKDPHNQQTGWSYGDTKEFDDTPWIYCMLNNFGGRLGMHGHLDTMAEMIPEALNTANYMAGIGIAPEASVNNPVLYEFIFECIWQDDAAELAEVIDLDAWLDDYATRRYGAASESANQAWDILKDTTYKASLNMLGQGAPESVVNARPNLSIGAASTWGNAVISYDKIELQTAAELLLEDYDILKDSEGYQYDVATLLQQVLSNSAQEYHSKMASAFSERDLTAFDNYAEKFMGIIDAMEKVTASNEYYLLGRWVEMAKALGANSDDFTKELYEFNAKALITTWGSYEQAESGGLKDYSNRQWSGLINDFYKERWERWITARHNELAGEAYEQTINWFEWEWSWVRGNTVYTTTPTSQDFSILGADILTNYGLSKNLASETKYDISIEGMTATAGSFQPENDTEGLAFYAIDDNQGTIWHTNYNDTNIDNAWLNIELAAPATVNGIRYLPRSGSSTANGKIKKFDLYVKVLGAEEYQLVLDDYAVETETQWQWALFDAVENVTDVKFVAVETAGDSGENRFAAVAELRIMQPLKEEETPVCQHTNTKKTPKKDPTCTAKGIEEMIVCEDCETIISGGGEIPALSHTWGEWTTKTEATVLTAAVQIHKCMKCDAEESQTIGEKLTASIETNAKRDAITLKKGQITSGLEIMGLAEGDFVVSIESDNRKVVTVSNVNTTKGTCKLKGVKKGKANITITLKSGLKKVLKVTVQTGRVKTTAIANLNKRVNLKKGKSLTLKPVLVPFTSQEKLTYQSNKKDVAVVTSKGKITTKKKGKAVITVKSGKKSVKITVNVR